MRLNVGHSRGSQTGVSKKLPNLTMCKLPIVLHLWNLNKLDIKRNVQFRDDVTLLLQKPNKRRVKTNYVCLSNERRKINLSYNNYLYVLKCIILKYIIISIVLLSLVKQKQNDVIEHINFNIGCYFNYSIK